MQSRWALLQPHQKTHPLLLHLRFPAWLLNLSSKTAWAGLGKPTDRVSGALPPPLFTLHWSAVSRVQYNQSYTQTQWQCPPHGSLSNTGIRALREPTGFRQTALRAFPCSHFSFHMALPLFLFYCAYCALSLYRSPSPVCQDCLYFWKSSPSPSLAGMKQTTSAAGGLLQLCCCPPTLPPPTL